MRKSLYPKEQDNSLGSLIRKSRMDSKKTLWNIATPCNITDSYLLRIEQNKQKPSAKIAMKISIVLNNINIFEKYFKNIEKKIIHNSQPYLYIVSLFFVNISPPPTFLTISRLISAFFSFNIIFGSISSAFVVTISLPTLTPFKQYKP